MTYIHVLYVLILDYHAQHGLDSPVLSLDPFVYEWLGVCFPSDAIFKVKGLNMLTYKPTSKCVLICVFKMLSNVSSGQAQKMDRGAFAPQHVAIWRTSRSETAGFVFPQMPHNDWCFPLCFSCCSLGQELVLSGILLFKEVSSKRCLEVSTSINDTQNS